jgi:alpha/beta superfamily hydrolase
MSIETDRALAREATRDAANGTTERVEFRGEEGDRIYTYAYEPASRPRGAVLICPAIHAEFTRSYRREVLLARRLASEGFAVERFHYRGTGNSDGDGEDVRVETLRDDAVASLAHLQSWSGIDAPVLMGTRWGALVAASAAAGHPSAPLVLWEPLLDASRFFRDAFRTKLVNDRKSGVENPETGDVLGERLLAGESVDLIGHTIEPALYASSLGRTLESELGSTPRAMLIIQIATSLAVRPDLAARAETWRSAGFEVDIEPVEGAETWWLVDERWTDEGRQAMTGRLIDVTVDWAVARAERGTA